MALFPALNDKKIASSLSPFEKELYRKICIAYKNEDYHYDIQMPAAPAERKEMVDALTHLEQLHILFNIDGYESYQEVEETVTVELEYNMFPSED